MNTLFLELVGDGLEFFMDDFSIFGSTFDAYLEKLKNIVKICIENNLLLSLEKSHFMVQEGIVLGHRVSKHGLEVVTKRFMWSLKHTNVGQTKFIIPNSQ